MNIKEIFSQFLTKEQIDSLENLTTDAQEKMEKLGNKIIAGADKKSQSLEQWIRNDGKEMYHTFQAKLTEFHEKHGKDSINLKDEANKIFDDIYGDSDGDSLEDEIQDAEKTIKESENFTAETSHLDALKSIPAIDDSFMKAAQDFLDGKSSKPVINKNTHSDSSNPSEGKTHGFTDSDNDGDDIIDDAIIED